MKKRAKNFGKGAWVLMALILMFNCKSDDGGGIVPMTMSSAKELISFNFLQANNNIPVNTSADISGSSVTIFLPPGTDVTNLVASFQVSSGATVSVNGTDQQSAVTANDFTSAATYQVTAEDGSTADYVVAMVTDFKEFDASIAALQSQFSIPGVQLAISRDGMLMYQKSYGLADSVNQVSLENSDRFRIAGLTKVVKRIAILKLIEDGLLSLDDTVFGSSGILETDFGTPPYGPEIENITVAHLLTNSSGWTDDPGDPTSGFPSLGQPELISEVLDNKPLAHSPGSAMGSSNMGFLILGRVIEKVSGQSMDDYLQANIFQPLGITGMELAGNLLSDRKSDEVKYYSQEGFDPYDIDVARRDNYLANAKDLIRFLRGIDRLSNVPDLITPNTLALSNLNDGGWKFSGSYSGTAASIGIPTDPFTFSIISNTNGPSQVSSMIAAMENEINARQAWPSYDSFDLD